MVNRLNAEHRKHDIIWILIDGVRPDKLHSCGNVRRPKLFIDEILNRGVLFSNVIAAGTNSKTSMHSAFSALNPAVHRMNAYDPELQLNFDPRVVTLTDLLKVQGYTTFRFVDAVQYEDFYDIQQVVPVTGFDVWESGGYARLSETPHHSFATEQRAAFIERFNRCSGPKFAYLHLLTSHEIYPERVTDCTWTSKIYEEGLREVSDDFEQVWNSLRIDENTLVAVTTDHGVRLDCHLLNELLENGINLRDQSCRTFCSFIVPGHTPRTVPRMVRNIDIAPTLLELAGCGPMPAQGVSLVPFIQGSKLPPLPAFIEGVGSYEIPCGQPRVANIWGVRTEKWKYWVHATRGESLFDLETDPEEQVNLIGTGLVAEDELRRLVVRELREHPQDAEQVYVESETALGVERGLRKSDIRPEVSVFLLAGKEEGFLAEAVRAVRAQLAVYWELCVVRFDSFGTTDASLPFPGDFRVRYSFVASSETLAEMLKGARGDYVLVLPAHVVLAPFALYRLREAMRAGGDVAVADGSGVHALVFGGKLRTIPVDDPVDPMGAGWSGRFVLARVNCLDEITFAYGLAAVSAYVTPKLLPRVQYVDESLGTLYLRPGGWLRLKTTTALSLATAASYLRRGGRRLRRRIATCVAQGK